MAAASSENATDAVEVDLHQLQHRWTLWTTMAPPSNVGSKNVDWDSLITEVISLHTVEEFWAYVLRVRLSTPSRLITDARAHCAMCSIFNTIKPPSALPATGVYYVFKSGIRPAWEDPTNAMGGRWTAMLNDPPSTDIVWESTVRRTRRAVAWRANGPLTVRVRGQLLALIGDMMDAEDDISGVALSLKSKKWAISIWTKSAHNEELQHRIGCDRGAPCSSHGHRA